MLARPEIDTKEYILLWLASKDPKGAYDWSRPSICPCGQYSQEHHGYSLWWLKLETQMLSGIYQLNRLAYKQPHTFGALYERARMMWETP